MFGIGVTSLLVIEDFACSRRLEISENDCKLINYCICMFAEVIGSHGATSQRQGKKCSSWEYNLGTKISCTPTEYFCAKSAGA